MKRVYVIHRWVSLFSAIFFLIFCMTGLGIMFRADILGGNQQVAAPKAQAFTFQKGWEQLGNGEKAI